MTRGLYDPRSEHDACGVGFIADLSGRPSRRTIDDALTVLRNLEHRGATGAEPDTGDGAGILISTPHRFLMERAFSEMGISTPLEEGTYAAGNAFIRKDADPEAVISAFARIAEEEGLKVVGARPVPHDPEGIGHSARLALPHIYQLAVSSEPPLGIEELEVRAFCLRKVAEKRIPELYLCSLSPRTIVYKGMLMAHQLEAFYPELSDPLMESPIALVHSRFSTNTFPSWPLAHPYRYIAHNGEINTLQGNRNWMRARELLLSSDRIPGDLERLTPILTPGASDSASFDEALELLYMGGRPLYHGVLMMIPEAWEHHESMDPKRRAFYRFHACLMEPWDGPAVIAFTDGSMIGAVLDRNGLRPARYWVTDDNRVIFASEVGVLEVDPASVVEKGRLQPGRIFLADVRKGRIVSDDEIKGELASEHPYQEWLAKGMSHLEDLPPRYVLVPKRSSPTFEERLFGYTEEDLRVILAPMAKSGAEPVGSMGNDAPLAVLSDRPKLVYDYFCQLFAQVTNPPLDAIREELVTSMMVLLGPQQNLFAADERSCRRIVLSDPVLSVEDLAKLMYVHEEGGPGHFRAKALDGLFELAKGGAGLKEGLELLAQAAERAIDEGYNLIVISDRHASPTHAPIPSLLAVGAVHHHLVRVRKRLLASLVVESGDCREVHHVACLLGYGASAVCPYVAYEAIEDMVKRGEIKGLTLGQALRNYRKALVKGVLKIMSKMGISTVASYTGAQVFEAVGLHREVIDTCFAGTVSRIQGSDFDVLAREVAERHRKAFASRPEELAHRRLEVGGEYQWRREGEYHLFNPRTVFKLQHSTRAGRYEIFKEYTRLVDDQSKRLATLRGLFELVPRREPVPIEEVEPVSEIVKRFSTGAMSYGSISKEAHETLAIAMNRLGGKSNTGEGGEDPERYVPDENGDSRRSAIKQVASARFGVTSEYLVNADALQIKIAQGAKPGEGGQLPGHKVYPWIAKTRHSTPGVGLISPPPHHDIYSIEDLAQLIHDLKNANPEALVHVKLVAEVGVGTVAAGVAKAKADLVLISGHDGGTGASPISSIKHAGVPWELGLAETQQTLIANGLRDRIIVQVDGQMKTGRDVIVAALLGAEEYGFATAPLVVSGCIMMRVCHLDTCPVGVATQNPELRKRFSGKPEFVQNFFEYVAEEVREYLAFLGFRSLDEAIGHTECLDVRKAVDHWKARGLDLSPIFARPTGYHAERSPLRRVRPQDHGLEKALDNKLIELAEPALSKGEKVSAEMAIRNTNRTVGTMLGYHVTKRYGGAGLPDDTITFTFRGSAGQSFGAFLPRGITLRLIGDANDYLAKGLSGGRIIVVPPEESPFPSEKNVIVGNVVAYGATSGELFVRGLAGERFCVRNSGAVAVVEGVGDHGCEYMTGGRVVVLGPTGRNFAAGMSGGIAYVYDPGSTFSLRLNTEMVALEQLEEEDVEFLREIIGRFHKETASEVAAAILEDFDGSLYSFRKVMPRDYRRVLDATQEALARGEDPIKLIMAAAHG